MKKFIYFFSLSLLAFYHMSILSTTSNDALLLFYKQNPHLNPDPNLNQNAYSTYFGKKLKEFPFSLPFLALSCIDILSINSNYALARLSHRLIC